MHLPCVEHLKALMIIVGGAQADLYRARRVHQPFPGRVPEHGAMVDALALFVRPGVAVGVEVDQRQCPVLAGMGLEQWIGNEMVAAKRQHRRARIEDVLGVGFDHFGRRLRRTVVEIAIAVVDDRQVIERIKRPRPMPFPGDPGRGGANAPWPEACAGAVAGGRVERHATDGHINAAQVTTVTATHETGDTGVGTFSGRAIKAVTGKGLIVLHRDVH
ncbi:hypothetical protein D9M71_167960 [compost metagenome]